MGVHYYDSCPWSDECKEHRLAPAVDLSRAGIPCVVWAEDALSFVHFVPTCLFALQLFIPDDLLESAASLLTTSQSFQVTEPPKHWYEFPAWDKTTPLCYPRSVALRNITPEENLHAHDPREIWLHPQSFFSFDVRDTLISVTLDDFPDNIRFPARPAFLDTIIQVLLEPPLGFDHKKFSGEMMVYYAYLLQYTMRGPIFLPSGELGPVHKMVLGQLKEENRPYLLQLLSRVRGHRNNWHEAIATRREVMRKLGSVPSPAFCQ